MKTKDRELTPSQTKIAQVICDEELELMFNKKVKPVRDKHYRLMKTDASDEAKQKSYDNFNEVLEKFQTKCRQIRSEAYTLYEDIMQDKPVLQDRCPDGITIYVQDDKLEDLLMYSHYPSARRVDGITGVPGQYLPAKSGCLNIEVRLQPDKFKLLYPKDYIYYNRELAETSKIDTGRNELLMYLKQYPTVIGGPMKAHLDDEKDFLSLLYVEGVQMSKVRELLLQKPYPQINQTELQQALQFIRIMEEGVKVVDQQIELTTLPRNMVASVTRDYQHMYVGEGKELASHQYYEKDIRPKYDDALKEAAELELRKLGFIKTLPHSLDVRWADTRGDNWECSQMTQVFNDMFRGYSGKFVHAEQSGEWMRLDIYTSNPEYQKRIMDTVNHSWAKREVREITDIEEMPEEIAKAQQEARAEKEELHTYFVDFETAYFYEKDTPGYVMMEHDRTFTCYGEPLSDSNMKYIKELAERGNILRTGKCVLGLCGPERLYIDKHEGTLVRICEETIDGKKVLVDRASRNTRDMQSARYQEVTGRITDINISSRKNGGMYITCKVDGVKQMGERLKPEDMRTLADDTDRIELAARYFKNALVAGQEQSRSMKR